MIFLSNWVIFLINTRSKFIFFLIWLFQGQLSQHFRFQNFSQFFSAALTKYVFFFPGFLTFKICHIFYNTKDFMVSF